MITVDRHSHGNMWGCVRMDDGKSSEWFEIEQGLRQGCVLAPVYILIYIIFTAVLNAAKEGFLQNESMIKVQESSMKKGMSGEGWKKEVTGEGYEYKEQGFAEARRDEILGEREIPDSSVQQIQRISSDWHQEGDGVYHPPAGMMFHRILRCSGSQALYCWRALFDIEVMSFQFRLPCCSAQ